MTDDDLIDHLKQLSTEAIIDALFAACDEHALRQIDVRISQCLAWRAKKS
jgi:hypothetical protein